MEELDFSSDKMPLFASHLAAKFPERLHHYTGQSGIRGIIESSEMHATKAQYMNDATEFQLGLELAEDLIKNRMMRLGENGGEQKQRLADLFPRKKGIGNVNIFVACFCELPDLLSQWRGYSGGSYGYSLAINTARLRPCADRAGFTLAQCIYDPATQAQIIDELITYCLQIEDIEHRRVEFERGLLRVGAFFKDRRFQEEQEWRIVSEVKDIRHDMVGFRDGRSMIVPYFRLAIGEANDSAIDAAIIGPCPHPQQSQSSIQMMFLRHGVAKVDNHNSRAYADIRISEVPYRNW